MSPDVPGGGDPLDAMIRTFAMKVSRGEMSIGELAGQVDHVIKRAEATASPNVQAIINDIVVWLAYYQHGDCSEAEFRAAIGEVPSRR